MSKKANDLSLRLWVSAQTAKQRMINTLQDKSGGVFAEHGLIIAGVAALALIVFLLIRTFAVDRFIPKMEDKTMNIFDMT